MNRFFQKISLLILVALSTSTCYSQTLYFENFDTLTKIPAGWAKTSLATDGGWIIGDSADYGDNDFFTPGGKTKFAATCDEICLCNKSDDLMKTDTLDLRGYSELYLSFSSFYFQYRAGNKTELAKVKISKDGGATWVSTLPVPPNSVYDWQTVYINLTNYLGDSTVVIAFSYTDNGGNIVGWGVDDVKIFVPETKDLQTVAISPVPKSYNEYFAPGDATEVSFSVFNNSSKPVSSFDATYTDNGGSPVTETFDLQTIAPYTYSSQTFGNQFTISTAGKHVLKVVVNLPGDANPETDTISVDTYGYLFKPVHNLVIEEATGTWCGWCPRGTVFMDSISHVHPGNPVLIAVHDRDPMQVTSYRDPLLENFLITFPKVLPDRKTVIDPSYLFPVYDSYVQDFGFANMAATGAFDPVQRKSTVDVTVKFAIDMSHSIRLACVYLEDGVHGTTTGYNQTNYFSYTIANMPMEGAGFDWQLEEGSVSASKMFYNNVARAIVGGFKGQPGTLPSPIVANTEYTYKFTYNVSSAYNVSNMKMAVLLIDATDDVILNATTVQSVTGITDVKSNIEQLSVYPNPASDELNILFSLTKPESVTIQLTDIMGRTISTTAYNNLAATSQMMQIPVNQLSSGIYMVNIKTGSGMVSRKFVKE